MDPRHQLLAIPAAASLLIGTATADEPTPVPRIEAYDSWKMAKTDEEAPLTAAATIQAPMGFAVEMIRAATPEDGSWVGVTFDLSLIHISEPTRLV